MLQIGPRRDGCVGFQLHCGVSRSQAISDSQKICWDDVNALLWLDTVPQRKRPWVNTTSNMFVSLKLKVLLLPSLCPPHVAMNLLLTFSFIHSGSNLSRRSPTPSFFFFLFLPPTHPPLHFICRSLSPSIFLRYTLLTREMVGRRN